jgi:hypothetical protein
MIHTAKTMLPGAPKDADDALRAYNADRRAKGLPPIAERAKGRALTAYISEARWVADCEECGAGIAVFDDGDSTCLGCGARWQVKMPPVNQRAAVEAALDERDERHRNWDPRRRDDSGGLIETAAFLRAETEIMRDVPVGITPAGFANPPVDLKILRPELAEVKDAKGVKLDALAKVLKTDQLWGDGPRVLAAVPQTDLDRALKTLKGGDV